MKIRSFVLCVVVVALALPVIAAEKSPITPGKWQMTMQVDMPGVPFKIPPVTVTNCITKEQAENPEATIPKEKKGDCKMVDHKVNGNTITWDVECPKSKTEGHGEITYSGDTYDGTMKMDMDGTVATTKYSGKRLGDCEK